jgi:hypothetical protein
MEVFEHERLKNFDALFEVVGARTDTWCLGGGQRFEKTT